MLPKRTSVRLVSQKNINLDIVRLVCLTLLIIGIAFRFISLEQTVYSDTIQSLASEQLHHPPFYVLLVRQWTSWFGGTIAISRLLPGLLSLLSLPLLYALALELFGSPLTALFSTVLLAISPLEIFFAQTNAVYSLLSVVIIGSSGLLIRALRRFSWLDWITYGISVALGLYTHSLFGLTILVQGSYVLFLRLGRFPNRSLVRRRLFRKPFERFLVAMAIALLLYLPWLVVLIRNREQLLVSLTAVTATSTSILELLRDWYLNFTALFINLEFGLNEPFTYFLRLPIVLFLALALDTLRRRALWPGWLFVITSFGVPFFGLVLVDLLLSSNLSAMRSNLLPCYPAIYLMMGFWLTELVREGRRFWQGAIAIIALGAITSNLLNVL